LSEVDVGESVIGCETLGLQPRLLRVLNLFKRFFLGRAKAREPGNACHHHDENHGVQNTL
jgi:hypothetical protein